MEDSYTHLLFPVASERRRCLNKLADLVEQNVDEFAHLEAISIGKPISAYGDAGVAVETFRCPSR